MTSQPRVAAFALAVATVPTVAIACALPGGAETVAVERAVDGDTVELDDGRIVRLAGVSAPKAPLGVRPADWPSDAEARDALSEIAAGKVFEFRPAAGAGDRHGRLLGFFGEIEGDDHAAVATRLLERGAVRYAADAAGRGCGATLAAAEALAIRARLGLWSRPYYAVLDAGDRDALIAAAGRFVVAEGHVASVRTSAGRAYVNFGERWRDALSLSLSEAALRRLGGFEALGVKVGTRLRVRGTIEPRLGPTIYVSEAAQVERLDGRKR